MGKKNTLGGRWGRSSWRLVNIFLIFFLLSRSISVWSGSEFATPPFLDEGRPFMLDLELPFLFLALELAGLVGCDCNSFLDLCSFPPELSELENTHGWAPHMPSWPPSLSTPRDIRQISKKQKTIKKKID